MSYHYLCKTSSGAEYYEDRADPVEDFAFLAKEIVKRAKIFARRSNKFESVIQFYSLHIVQGEIERRPIGSWRVTPPLLPMNEEEYQNELKIILNDIPVHFHNFISSQVWGVVDFKLPEPYEKALDVIGKWVDVLYPAIKAYKLEIQAVPS